MICIYKKLKVSMIIGDLHSGKLVNLNIWCFKNWCFRAIFDNEEYVEFKKKLEDRVKHHDKDIERLCNVYYQGFIESVRELLDVRTQSNKLNVRNLIYLQLQNV